MAAFHQAEHFTRQPADAERFLIELAGEWIERRHDIGNSAIAVNGGVWSFFLLCFVPQSRVGLFHHLLAEVYADQIVLEDVVVEHVLGSFTKVDDPFSKIWRLDAECHVLRITCAGGVVVAADPANSAGDEMSITRVFALHENAVPAKNGGGAVALRNLFVLKIDLGEDAQAAHNTGDGVPTHFYEVPLFTRIFG